MNHPTTPLPPHLLPTMQKTLVTFRELASLQHSAVFICFVISDAESDLGLQEQAQRFIQQSLAGHWALSSWLREYVSSAYAGIANEARIEWLEWLTKEKS